MAYDIVYSLLKNETKLPFFVESIGDYKKNEKIVKMNDVPFYQIIYCSKGEGVFYLEGKKHLIKEKNGIFIPKLSSYEYYITSNEPCIHMISFDGGSTKVLLKHFGMDNERVDTLLEINKLDEIYNRIYKTIRDDKLYGTYYASAYLYEFLIEYFRIITKQMSINNLDDSCPILPVLDYIDNHYKENIKLEYLCELIDVSPQHLCRLFKKYLHVRPNEYIARKRISMAKRMLIYTDKKIFEIAKELGFTSTDYFTLVFKKYERILPSQFRIDNKKSDNI